MDELKVLMYGLPGSGKTVYLSVLYHELSIPGPGTSWYVELPPDQGVKLNKLYAQISNPDADFPAGTRVDTITTWNFMCRVQTADLHKFSVAKFTYFDYAGERTKNDPTGEFHQLVRESDVVMGMFDGRDILQFMENTIASSQLQEKYGTMITDIQSSDTIRPIHFIITKWDILESKFKLEDIRNRLLTDFDVFKRFVASRSKAGMHMRLIPISSLGEDFVEPQPNGAMKKKGKAPTPAYVDVPFACVLPDSFSGFVQELTQKRVDVEAAFKHRDGSSPEQNGKFSTYVNAVSDFYDLVIRQIAPGPVNAAEGLFIWVKKVFVGTQAAEREKQRRELRLDRDRKVAQINDEKAALEFVARDLLNLVARFDAHFRSNRLL